MKKVLFKARKRSRGAAMIEAVIVVSTMLVFMGGINFTRQSYGMKQDLQQQTRANTLFFASHGCEGAGGGGATTGAGGAVPAGNNPAAKPAGQTGQPGASAAASRSYNTANASTQGTTNFQATWDANANGGNGSINLQKQTGNRTITAASKVTCNEKKYENQWLAWAQFGMDFAMNLGGASSLFN